MGLTCAYNIVSERAMGKGDVRERFYGSLSHGQALTGEAVYYVLVRVFEVGKITNWV